MIYAQFFHKSAIGPELVQACGDRSVVILDGRQSHATHRAIAREECQKRLSRMATLPGRNVHTKRPHVRHAQRLGTTMDLNITAFFREAAPRAYFASAAELGNDARLECRTGPATAKTFILHWTEQ